MRGSLATRSPVRLRPDPSRVVAQLFVPGHALPGGREWRASGVVEHVLALDDDEVDETLASVVARFGGRHRDLTEMFSHNADRIGNRLDPRVELSEERWLLLGASFTSEYAVEGAALCNPSAMALPDQTDAPAGALRFALSTRQIGEGHRSTIGFRTGLLDAHGAVSIDPTGPFTTVGAIGASVLDADTFRGVVQGQPDDVEATTWVLDGLAARFTTRELDARLLELSAQRDTRRGITQTVDRLRGLAARTYTARFPSDSSLGERVLHPATAVEANGMEDARFVRFVDDDGAVTFYATYTAYDGVAITQQLLVTTDFLTFEISPLFGAAAANKGLALFPRRIGGRLAALSRADGASNGIVFSDDIRRWPAATPLLTSTETWEVVQVGNCGPPIETDEGWLMLTHGVGPMRSYAIGAWLLDLEDPTRVIGRLRSPLLTPLPEEQDGYVPNVVYSCGGLVHDGTLLLPFGVSDATIGFATVPVDDLLTSIAEDTLSAAAPARR